jgi:anti-anti-sigma factor
VDHTRIQVISDGEVDLVHIEGTLDLASSPRLRTILLHHLENGSRHFVIDLARVDLIDCTAVSAMVSIRTRTQRTGGWLRVVGARGMVVDILEISGVRRRAEPRCL